MLNDSVIDELQSKALSVLECTLDKHYTYHNAAHTREVCDAGNRSGQQHAGVFERA